MATTQAQGDDISPRTADPSSPEYFPEVTATSSGETQSTAEPENKTVSFGQLSKPGDKSKTSASQFPTESSVRRKSSVSSVTFRPPRDPTLPQGQHRTRGSSRQRGTSPPPTRFSKHVAFDNVPIGEATKNNMPSYTLNWRHKGYQPRRRSRTFMCGVDENTYSDYALQWLLRELVDDGDEVICVRVIEKETRLSEKQYQDEAKKILEGILAKNEDSRALSFVLEYAVGKLHSSFQKLIHMYEPAMLIVGTRGRSLGGLQGLVNTRNSFSKYCLQYSPVPVVVVRPDEKRLKKKTKRANDSTRQTYVRLLAATNGKHEADSEASSVYDLEVHNTPDDEAHQVAKVLGLPARFDPTIKPLKIDSIGARTRSRTRSPGPSTLSTPSASPETRRVSRGSTSNASNAGDSESEDEEDDGTFEVVSGAQALEEQEKQNQLHKMEVGEAAALKMPVNVEEDDSDDEGGATTAATAAGESAKS